MDNGYSPLPGATEEGATAYQLVCPIGGIAEEARRLLAGETDFINLILLGPGNQQIHVRYMPGKRVEECAVKDPYREYVHIYCGDIYEIDPISNERIGQLYKCNGGFGTETTGYDIPIGNLIVLPKE